MTSTISSPRLSITSAQTPTPTSSRRPSVEQNTAATSASTPTARTTSPSIAQRRNRAALRDYYNLRPNRTDSSQSTQPRSRSIPSPADNGYDPTTLPSSAVANNELDGPNFDPSAYVSHMLSASPLSTILKAENSLVSDIRTLDGERKALVYDNYSKLIKAVETIGKMRASMEERGSPMAMTKTLAPAVGFVAETAGALIREQEELRKAGLREKKEFKKDEKDAEEATVRWVLDTPRRLRLFIDEGNRENAEKDWAEVDGLLAKWEGVKGVNDLRRACEDIMERED